MYLLTPIITLDGHKYVVKGGTYSRDWQRAFNSNLTWNVRLTVVDRGTGLQIYKMTLELRTWPASSLPHKLGVTDTWDIQLANLEASYIKRAKILQFIDPFGNVPVIPGTSSDSAGVYFVGYLETMPPYSTPDSPSVYAAIDLQNAAGPVF